MAKNKYCLQNKRHSSAQGFTIVETIFVLAISSLMFILMMTGITLAVQRQHFSDSVNSTQSFLQQQFNEVQNVLNDRLDTNPGSGCNAIVSVRGGSDCLILGRLIDLQAGNSDTSSIVSYVVVGDNINLDNQPPGTDDVALFNAANPQVYDDSPNNHTFELPWGVTLDHIREGVRDQAGTMPVRYVAILRSLKTGATYVLKTNLGTGPLFTGGSPEKIIANGGLGKFNANTIKACFTSGEIANTHASLEVNPIGSQDGIVTWFDINPPKSPSTEAVCS